MNTIVEFVRIDPFVVMVVGCLLAYFVGSALRWYAKYVGVALIVFAAGKRSRVRGIGQTPQQQEGQEKASQEEDEWTISLKW
jgi:hypothetical protein